MASSAPQGGNLAAVKEEEVVDPCRFDIFYESPGAMTPTEIDDNVLRKTEIRRQRAIVSGRIADQLEIDAENKIRRHRDEGPALTRDDLSKVGSEMVWILAAALTPVSLFESIQLDPASGDMKKNLEELCLRQAMVLEKEERRDIDSVVVVSPEHA